MLESHAEVVIDRPARWAKQLADHFSHKLEVQERPEGRVLHFSVGEGVVSNNDIAVLLTARAETADELARVQDVLARHLERFAHREEITVSWS